MIWPRSYTLTQIKRLLLKRRQINRKTNCWEWTGLKHNDGYGVVGYRGTRLYVHRAAASFWLGFNLKSKKFICHKCDNPPCFNPKHLFIGDPGANHRDAIKKQRYIAPRGEEHCHHKLTDEKVKEIRRLFVLGWTGQQIADKFGLASNTPYLIKWRLRWKHVPEEN